MSSQKKKSNSEFKDAFTTNALGMGGAAIGAQVPLAIATATMKDSGGDKRKFLSKANKHHKMRVPVYFDQFQQRDSHWMPNKKALGIKEPRVSRSAKKGTDLEKQLLRALMPRAKRQGSHGSIHTSKDAHLGVLAHEWGHSKDLGKSRLATLLTGRLSRMAAPALGVAASSSLATSDDELKNKIAPYTTGLLSIPILRSEGAATYHGTKEIVRQHGLKRGLKSLLVTAPAFGTYLAPTVGTYLGTKYYLKNKKKKGQD